MDAAVKQLSADEIENIQNAIEQTDAIFALEGFEPTEQSRAIRTAVLTGCVTFSQVAEELRDYIVLHKSSDGFMQSCI